MFLSEYLDIDYEILEECGVFDAILEKDSAFFINVQRLKKTEEPEFLHSYERIQQFFIRIATILEAADRKDLEDRFFREAVKRFAFSEVNEINLGFGDSYYFLIKRFSYPISTCNTGNNSAGQRANGIA